MMYTYSQDHRPFSRYGRDIGKPLEDEMINITTQKRGSKQTLGLKRNLLFTQIFPYRNCGSQ